VWALRVDVVTAALGVMPRSPLSAASDRQVVLELTTLTANTLTSARASVQKQRDARRRVEVGVKIKWTE
jgi:hypothetical protein